MSSMGDKTSSLYPRSRHADACPCFSLAPYWDSFLELYTEKTSSAYISAAAANPMRSHEIPFDLRRTDTPEADCARYLVLLKKRIQMGTEGCTSCTSRDRDKNWDQNCIKYSQSNQRVHQLSVTWCLVSIFDKNKLERCRTKQKLFSTTMQEEQN